MDVLEKRQQDEMILIKDQAKTDKEALNNQMQLMREADMKAQTQLKNQLEIVVNKEKQANKALQDMRQLLQQSTNDAKADRDAANVKFKQMKEESIKDQKQLQDQLSAISLREAQTNERLNNMMQIWEEDKIEAANLKDEIRSLNEQLIEANKPGFIRRWWGKIF